MLRCFGLTCYFSHLLKHIFYYLFANGVVTSCIVVCSILLAFDQKFWMEELLVAAVTDLVDWGRIEIDKDRSGHELVASGLGEKGVPCSYV